MARESSSSPSVVLQTNDHEIEGIGNRENAGSQVRPPKAPAPRRGPLGLEGECEVQDGGREENRPDAEQSCEAEHEIPIRNGIEHEKIKVPEHQGGCQERKYLTGLGTPFVPVHDHADRKNCDRCN